MSQADYAPMTDQHRADIAAGRSVAPPWPPGFAYDRSRQRLVDVRWSPQSPDEQPPRSGVWMPGWGQ